MSDRVAEAYYGHRGSERDTALVRSRVHWMCRRTAGPDVLDVGCSQGIAAILLARDGHRVTGVDVDPIALDFFRAELSRELDVVKSRVTIVHASITDVDLEPESFDSLLLGEVVEHLAEPRRFLESALRFIKIDGRVIATTPFGVHRDPDHKQTFYPHSFLALMGRYCAPTELHVTDAYMHFAGSRRPTPLADSEMDAMFAAFGRDRLESLEAEAFEAKELRYLDQLDALRTRRDKLIGQVETTRMARATFQKEHDKERRTLLARIENAHAELRRLRSELRQVESLRAKAISRRDRTVDFRIRRLAKKLRDSMTGALSGRKRSLPAPGELNSPPDTAESTESATQGTPPRASSTAIVTPEPGELRVLFIPTNGAGLGHLTRTLAVASRLSNGVTRASIAFHTTSLATREIERMGYPAYYLPPKSLRPDLSTNQWNELFARGLRDVIETHQIDLAVFDGVVAYSGLTKALAMSPDTRAVWISRGGWKQIDSHIRQLEGSHQHFSRIIVPGEIRSTIASDFDGISRELAAKLVFVNPLVLVAEDALLDREEALEHLRLSPARSHLLVQLGAGNINDTTGELATVVRELRARFPDAEITIAQSVIAAEAPQVDEKVHLIQKYPLSRYYRAFDLVVTAAGYNSLHECLLYGMPTVVIPNVETVSDDQVKRAEAAAAALRVESAHPFSTESFQAALSRLFGTASPERLREAWQPYLTENGADQAANVIRELLLASMDASFESDPLLDRSSL